MTPTIAASLIREATRGWTSAELREFHLELEDLHDAANEHERDGRYDEGYVAGKSSGYEDGYDDGYADAEGDADTR